MWFTFLCNIFVHVVGIPLCIYARYPSFGAYIVHCARRSFSISLILRCFCKIPFLYLLTLCGLLFCVMFSYTVFFSVIPAPARCVRCSRNLIFAIALILFNSKIAWRLFLNRALTHEEYAPRCIIVTRSWHTSGWLNKKGWHKRRVRMTQ